MGMKLWRRLFGPMRGPRCRGFAKLLGKKDCPGPRGQGVPGRAAGLRRSGPPFVKLGCVHYNPGLGPGSLGFGKVLGRGTLPCQRQGRDGVVRKLVEAAGVEPFMPLKTRKLCISERPK